MSSHGVSITRRVSELLHFPWSCSLPAVQLNVSIEATKPPELTSCPSIPDKLIHFVQVHRILHENPTPTHLGSEQLLLLITCVRNEGVQGVLTHFCSGAAQVCHDDRVVELKEQLGVEEVDGEGQEGKAKEERRGRIKESAPWMVWR